MPANNPAQIIVVEDDDDVRDSLCAMITALGHDCVAFESAELTLAYEGLSRCACMLVDFNLPGMTGTELLLQLQQSGASPPACLYTGRLDPRVRDAAGKLSNTVVLEKGNDPNSLAQFLKHQLH